MKVAFFVSADAFVAALISYNLFLALILDCPFSGSISVTPEPFRQGVLLQFEGPQPRARQPARSARWRTP